MTNVALPSQLVAFAALQDARIGPFNVIRTYCEAKWLIATGQAQLVRERPSPIGTLMEYRRAGALGNAYKPRWSRLMEEHLDELIRGALNQE